MYLFILTFKGSTTKNDILAKQSNIIYYNITYLDTNYKQSKLSCVLNWKTINFLFFSFQFSIIFCCHVLCNVVKNVNYKIVNINNDVLQMNCSTSNSKIMIMFKKIFYLYCADQYFIQHVVVSEFLCGKNILQTEEKYQDI